LKSADAEPPNAPGMTSPSDATNAMAVIPCLSLFIANLLSVRSGALGAG
jgi:hypothetical protein